MHIIAMSSSTLSGQPEAASMNRYILDLVPRERPRICFVPTATGDEDASIVSFYDAFPAERFQPVHLGLFWRTVEDLRSFVLAQDVVMVAGGNTANMLAIWRAHGLDVVLREAWSGGVVLCGWSAGGLCWFESGSTDSFGKGLAPLQGCLGFLAGSFCAHYDSEALRRPTLHRFLEEGALPGGWALDDGAALHFQGTELHRIVACRPGARAYRLARVDGVVRETPVEPEALWQP